MISSGLTRSSPAMLSVTRVISACAACPAGWVELELPI